MFCASFSTALTVLEGIRALLICTVSARRLQIKEDVPQESVREAEFYTGVLESPSVPQDPSLCSYDCNYVHFCCMFYLVFRYEVGASG